MGYLSLCACGAVIGRIVGGFCGNALPDTGRAGSVRTGQNLASVADGAWCPCPYKPRTILYRSRERKKRRKRCCGPCSLVACAQPGVAIKRRRNDLPEGNTGAIPRLCRIMSLWLADVASGLAWLLCAGLQSSRGASFGKICELLGCCGHVSSNRLPWCQLERFPRCQSS